MKTISRKDWFLLVVYGLALALLVVTALVTAYVLSHPESGLKEVNPVVIGLVSEYGLMVGLLVVNLYNMVMIMLLWVVFIPYLLLRKRHRWENILADALVYSVMAAYGFFRLISWLLNVAHDVSWLLFNSCPHIITTIWKLWDNAIYLIPAIPAVLFPIVYYLMKKERSKHMSQTQTVR